MERIKTLTKISLYGLILLWVIQASSMASVGTHSMTFSQLISSSKATAMANTVTAQNGIDSVFINPAALAGTNQRLLSSQWFHYLSDISYKQINYSQPVTNGVFFISYSWLDYGRYQRTTYSDKSGENSGTINNLSTAVIMSYAKKPKKTQYGLSIKFYKEKLANYKANQIGLDLGVLRPVSEYFSLGASITNLSLTKATYNKQSGLLKQTTRVGAVYTPKWLGRSVTIASDLWVQNSRIISSNGIQVALHDTLQLRAGVNSVSDLLGASLGVGMQLERMDIDFTYRPNETINDTYTIGMTVGF